MTITRFSSYQIDQISRYCNLCKVVNIGVIQESGDVLIEYMPPFTVFPSLMTIKIPKEKPLEFEDAEFESVIIEPKQLSQPK